MMPTSKEIHPNAICRFVYCGKCRKYQPMKTLGMVPGDWLKRMAKKTKVKLPSRVGIVGCGVCDRVLNWDKDPKIKKIRYAELKRKGWRVEKAA